MSNGNTPKGVSENPSIKQIPITAGLGGQVSTNVSQLIEIKTSLLDREETKNDIMEKIKNFPISKDTIETLKRITTTEISNEELLNEIKSDPSIVAKVLMVANSVMYGQGGRIPDISRALILLGFKIVYKITVSCLISNNVDSDMSPYGIHISDFVMLSGAQSKILEKWKEPKIEHVKSEIQLAAFLQEVGKIIIAMIIVEKDLTDIFDSKIKELGDVSLAEEYILGQTSAEITALIFSKWNLDKNMVGYIRYSDKPENAPDEYRYGSQALKIIKTASPISKEGACEESLNRAIDLADNYGFDEELLRLTVNLNN